MKEKLEKLKKLADAMYYAAANLGPTVGSGEHLRKTMEEYHKFIIHEYHKKEPASESLEEAANNFLTEFYGVGEPHNPTDIGFFKAGANWQKEQMLEKAVIGEICEDNCGSLYIHVPVPCLNDFSRLDIVRVLIIKED